MNMFIEFLGYSVLIMGIWDALKYRLISNKISRLKSCKEHSRSFFNGSIAFKFLFFLYGWLKYKDAVIMWTCAFALWTLIEAWYAMYLNYQYKNKKKKNFKRPSMGKYIINSFIWNKYRKRL